MRVLVTGGAGFIGSHLVDRLIKEGHKVFIIDNLSTGKKENLSSAYFRGASPKAKFYKIDILEPRISEIFKKEKPEVIYHYAAQIDIRKSVENPIEDAKINILGSLNIIQNFVRINSHLISRKSAKIIFASTGGAIYGDTNIIPTPESCPVNPESPYGITKLTIEKYLDFYQKTYGLNYIILRLANVYGPRQNSRGEAGVVAIFSDKIINNKQPIINGSGRQTRDFIFVDDVVDASILAIKSNKRGVYNVGTARETSINEVFGRIKKLTGSKCKKIYGPAKKGEQKRSCLNVIRAKKAFNWIPKTELDKGLIKTLEWFSNNNKYK